MNTVCFHGPARASQLILSLQSCLTSAGIPSMTLFEDALPERTSLTYYAAEHGCSAVILIDPYLEMIDSIGKEVPRLALYSPTYGRALSKDVVQIHEALDIPALWERVPSRIVEHKKAKEILLPPIPLKEPQHENFFKKSRGSMPHIATLWPPIEPQEARKLQQDYLSKNKRQTELLLITAPDNLEQIRPKEVATDMWYIPPADTKGCLWSLEMSTILDLGGRVVAAAPPDILKDIIPVIRSYDEAEAVLLFGNFPHLPQKEVRRRITTSCIQSLEQTGILNNRFV